MSLRAKRKKRVKVIRLSNQSFLKIRLIPFLKDRGVCIWLASMAISHSKRQINDWMNKRKSRSARRLSLYLTGKVGIVAHAYTMKQLKAWLKEIPDYDLITFRCESADPDRQFLIWYKWLARHLRDYTISTAPEFKSVFIHKKPVLE
jgi:hypothetical protein